MRVHVLQPVHFEVLGSIESMSFSSLVVKYRLSIFSCPISVYNAHYLSSTFHDGRFFRNSS